MISAGAGWLMVCLVVFGAVVLLWLFSPRPLD